jgi:hypothetical protein
MATGRHRPPDYRDDPKRFAGLHQRIAERASDDAEAALRRLARHPARHPDPRGSGGPRKEGR